MTFRNRKTANSAKRQKLKSPRQLSTLSITNEVLDIIEAESQRSPTTETGGVIAGTGTLDIDNVVITRVTAAGPQARSSKYSFSRDVSYCQQEIDRFARDSGGRVDYLGEWHKHHEEEPWPSPTDIRTLANIARDANYHVTEPILLIIGESDSRKSLRVFSVNAAGHLKILDWIASMPPELLAAD